jgi:histidine ammonia-lyase
MERLVWFLNERIVPAIPQEGSVGASGDLTPLSYVAAAVIGERSVWENGNVVSVADCYTRSAIEPLKLLPKESLSLMNGTAVMTGVACMAYHRAIYLAKLSCSLSALMVECLLGNRAHFDFRLFSAKPHPGQMTAAKLISDNLFDTEMINDRIQDTYALRCAPAIIGVLFDALEWVCEWIETELNSACDNPLLDTDSGDILHGGNFYGGHIAFAMDSLKNAVANIADLIDRQVALLLNNKRNRNLPLNLSGADEDTLSANHGFKAVQISCSAWTAEALKNTMPASVFSRSTESHNQDKVSMGTIAARDSIRTLELTEQVAAGALLASMQALDLRIKSGVISKKDFSEAVQNQYESIRAFSPMVTEDRPLEDDLRTLLIEIRNQSLPVL